MGNSYNKKSHHIIRFFGETKEGVKMKKAIGDVRE